MNFLRAIGLVLIAVSTAFGQGFDSSVYRENEARVDCFLTAEDSAKLEKALDQQIEHLISTAQDASLYHYVYKVGRTHAQRLGLEKAVKEVEGLISLIRENDPDTSHVLSAINDLSWTYYEAGMDSLCLATDLRFLELCEKYRNASPLERSDAHYNVGFDYQMMGNTAKAIYHFEKSLEPVATDTPKYIKKLMDCYNALGAAYWRNGQLSEAKKSLLASDSLARDFPDTTWAKLYRANALGNLSLIYEDQANLAKSMELLETSIDLRKDAIPNLKEAYDRDLQTQHLIANYHNLSALYLSIGDLDRAIAMTEYVDELQREFYPTDHPAHQKLEEAKGSLELAAGNYSKAEKHLLLSLEGALKNFGEDSYYVATCNQRLGQLYSEWGKYRKALKHFNRTIDVARAISGEFRSQELAGAYRDRAELRVILEEYDLAGHDFRRAGKIFSQTRGEESVSVGNIHLNLAGMFFQTNQIDSADAYCDRALDIFEKNRKGNLSEQDGLYKGIVRRLPEAYLLKSRIIAKSGDDSLPIALAELEKAMNYLQEERRNFESDGSQLVFIDNHSEIYGQAAQWAYDLFKREQDVEYKEDILRYAEERKTVLLKRRLNKFSSLRVANIPDSIISKEEVLLSKLSDPEAKAEYAQAEEDYDALLDLIRSEYPAYYNLRYDSKTASLEDIQQDLLGPNQIFVEYIDTGERLLAVVISPKKAEVIELPSLTDQKAIERLNAAILAGDHKRIQQFSSELYRGIFAPLLPFIEQLELLIVPDGDLYALNFETLLTEQGNFLIENHTISYLLSATTALLYRDLEKNEKHNSALALAPGFENGENISPSGQRFIRQPFAVHTAQLVEKIFSGKSLVAADASESKFREEADQFRIIHLGTHTEINPGSPMLSRLILSRSADDDGYLHAYELYNLSLRAELAVLTACETGVGKASSSEGMLSMAHGFAYAGCPSLVMSLWKIDEKTSATIIEEFYENLAEGMAKNEAIREAKLTYLKEADEELRNPYYWSGLVLYGDIAAIPGDAAPDWWLWLAALALVGLLLILRFRKKRA